MVNRRPMAIVSTALFSAALAVVGFGSMALKATTRSSKPLVVVSGPSGTFQENLALAHRVI